jgi:hypothetical protein
VTDADVPVIRLERWTGPWPDDDPDANFKSEVALYALTDPLETLEMLSRNLAIPLGALVRYVLARWASGGADAVLELGPSTVTRMWQVCEDAERSGTDDARLAAFRQDHQMLSWSRIPLHDDE